MSPRRELRTTNRARSEINVTPLIDIVLVLLIVFIVMVPGLSKALSVSVPRLQGPSQPPQAPGQVPVVVTLALRAGGKGCEIFLQKERVELDALAERICPVLQLQAAGQRKVFLKVDGEAPYQAAVDVLDQIRNASERAKAESLAKHGFEGGDTQVAVSRRQPAS